MGVKLAVGEVFDPINDIVESFSDIMLLSTVSVGIQKVLLHVGSSLGVKALVIISILIPLGVWGGLVYVVRALIGSIIPLSASGD